MNNYFNFTADAVAYINEVKWIAPKKGDAFIALKVCILEGENGQDKVYADLIARGKQALEVLSSFEEEWPQGYGDNRPKWFAGLRIGSLGTKPFLGKDGTPKAVLSGRLLAIKHLKIGEEEIEVPEWRSDAVDSPAQQDAPRQVSSQPEKRSQQSSRNQSSSHVEGRHPQQQRQNQHPANPQRQYARRGAA